MDQIDNECMSYCDDCPFDIDYDSDISSQTKVCDVLINVKEILRSNKKHKIISSEEALKDVVPINWSNDVLSGKKKVIIK